MPETENTISFRPNGQKIVMHGYDFFNGYQFGYRYYVTTCRHLPILDTGMYAFLMKIMSNVKHSDRWKAGVLVGWIAALLDYEANVYAVKVSSSEQRVVKLEVEDVNGDGKRDLVVTVEGVNQRPTLLNTGKGFEWSVLCRVWASTL